MNPRKPFLTARWKDLIVLNFDVEPSLLTPYIPRGTELDLWQGKALVSVVAFQFVDSRLLGYRIPFHEHFEEVNLRFYVRRSDGSTWKRGVVFVKELVPKRAIAAVARLLYNENYFAVRMDHTVDEKNERRTLTYRWFEDGRANAVSAALDGPPSQIPPNSEAEFILEHYWGYSRSRSGNTIEYEVTHPRWRIWDQPSINFEADTVGSYGKDFGSALSKPWHSAFVAEGSQVAVYPGRLCVQLMT